MAQTALVPAGGAAGLPDGGPMPESEDGGLGYFAIVYKGGVKLRAEPALDAPALGSVLDAGYVFAAASIRHVSEELDMVEVKGGGWLVMRMGDLVAVEPVDGPRVEPCAEKYRVVYPNGMSFALEPKLDSARQEEVHSAGAVVQAVRKVTPPGSKVSFVELADNLGYIFVGKTGALLERLNGQEVLERLSSEEEAWSGIRYLRVTHDRGLLVRRLPKLTSPHIGKLLQTGRVMAVSEVVRDVASKNEFAYLMDGSGWIRVRSQRERFVEPVDVPTVIEEDQWYRVVHPEGLEVRTGASQLAGFTQSLLMPGTIFLSNLQVRPPGQKGFTFAKVSIDAPPFVDYTSFLNSGSLGPEELDSTAYGRVQEVGEWVCVSEDALVKAEVVSAPVLGLAQCWHQVLAKDGVKMYASIDLTDEGGALTATEEGAQGNVMSFGSYFVSQRSFRPAGSPITYLQVGDGSDAEPMWVADRGTDDEVLVKTCDAPVVEADDFWIQVTNPEGAVPRSAPHPRASPIDSGSLAPYSVLRSTHLLRPPVTATADPTMRLTNGDADLAEAAPSSPDTAGRAPVLLFAMLDNGGWLFLQDASAEEQVEEGDQSHLHARLLPAPPLVLVGRRRYRIRNHAASMRVVTGPHPDAGLIYLAQPGHEIITTRELRIFGTRGGVFLEIEDGKGWIILAADASIEDDLYLALQPLPLQDEEEYFHQ